VIAERFPKDVVKFRFTARFTVNALYVREVVSSVFTYDVYEALFRAYINKEWML